ncbi:hypothetical protein [Acetobacterium malicum]|uniref:hypothetical protein n=1 Tax=Acetobacterium malicum TaxID=52692 RepID=UPI00047E90D2|nr:hypothetical protein [Acetobacterium dehalogenans]
MTKIKMDNDMIPIVNKINSLSYDTVWSCSGTEADHPDKDITVLNSFIGFLCNNISNQQMENLHNIANECGLFTKIKHNSIDGFVMDIYIPVIGKDGFCDLLNERFQKRVKPNTWETYYEIKTENEIKRLHGGVIEISDEQKLKIWNNFLLLLQPNENV